MIWSDELRDTVGLVRWEVFPLGQEIEIWGFAAALDEASEPVGGTAGPSMSMLCVRIVDAIRAPTPLPRCIRSVKLSSKLFFFLPPVVLFLVLFWR